jgi:hypothetical protein
MLRRVSNVVFALLAVAALGLAVVAVLVWTGHFDSGALRAPKARPQPRPRRPQPPPPPPPAAKSASVRHAPQTVRITVSATGGDCWIRAHRGASDGPVLLERVLRQGESVTIRAHPVWLELGAAGNVEVAVDGIARTIPTGTTSVRLG